MNSLISHGQSPNKDFVQTPATHSLRAELQEFELGRFLIEHQGLNGYWTNYVLLYPQTGKLKGLSSDGKPLTGLERWLLEKCPIFLATQERFVVFKKLTQPHLQSGMSLVSVPCGLMQDLLGLDYSAVQDISLIGIDLDPESLQLAADFSQSLANIRIGFEQRDAWELGVNQQWDFITSNGLNIYVEEAQTCIELYRGFARALKSGGYLLISFITPPEEWMPGDRQDLQQQRFLFTDVLGVKWQHYRAEVTVRQHLEAAGFDVLEIVYDSQRMFPAVLAQKSRAADHG